MRLDLPTIRAQAEGATEGRGRLMNHPWLTILERTELTEEELPGLTSRQKVELLVAARNVVPLCVEVERLRKELARVRRARACGL